MLVAAVIPTYNSFSYAERATRSFLDNTPDSHVFLIDDGSPEWLGVRWDSWPLERMTLHRFKRNDKNLTRSWNHGLVLARDAGAAYVTVTNSDVLFPPGWFEPVQEILDEGLADLVGPVTNAPGPRRNQDITRFVPDYVLADDDKALARTQKRLRELRRKVIDSPINGYCMVARTRTWWRCPHDSGRVFNPKHKMTKNEDELIGRFRRNRLKVAITPASFVFHYRGVSRGLFLQKAGSFRRS